MPQAVEILDAEAAVEKIEKTRNDLSLGAGKGQEQKKEVILKAQKDKIKVHLATLMKLCHLKNAELEHIFQKYKRRIVLRGDIVKDDSGLHAVFTEQGSSSSRMTAANVMDIMARTRL